MNADDHAQDSEQGISIPPCGAPEATSAPIPALPESNPTFSPDGGRTPTALAAEEQMALFEKELMENDWGHQPC